MFLSLQCGCTRRLFVDSAVPAQENPQGPITPAPYVLVPTHLDFVIEYHCILSNIPYLSSKNMFENGKRGTGFS